MSLSSDLISQFVKITNDEPEPKKESVVYGTVVKTESGYGVKLDGSSIATPITSENNMSTTELAEGNRVLVTIRNHTAIITGNLSSPSVGTGTVTDVKNTANSASEKADNLSNQISEFGTVFATKVETNQLRTDLLAANKADVDKLTAADAEISGKVTAAEGEIAKLKAEDATISGKVTASEGEISKLKTDKLDATVAKNTYATIENLTATNTEVNTIKGEQATFKQTTTDKLSAVEADIEELNTKKLSATDIEGKFANIDFANIGTAAVEKFYAVSGLIKNVTLESGTVVKELVGVLIKGDLIEGGTIAADKLIVKGEDGLYYKLNVNALGEATASSDVKYQNGLDGSVIIAKSIAAEKISVSDLKAFGATIGGFKIGDSAIHSVAKTSATNTTRGIYMDNLGQFVVGDASNYIKYFKDTDGNYKLDISTVNNLKIGGRNLVPASAFSEVRGVTSTKEFELRNCWATTYITNENLTSILEPATQYTVKYDIELIERTSVPTKFDMRVGFLIYSNAYSLNLSTSISETAEIGTKRTVQKTFTTPAEWHNETLIAYSRRWTTNGAEPVGYDAFKVTNFKIEKGNKATDWTPAPEDVDSDILNSSKTATNFLNFSSGGLVVGDMTAASLGRNILIGATDIKIRTGTTDNAVFGADLIELAKDNESATISMLNGAFKIHYDSDSSDGGFGIYGKTSTGEERLAFQPVNENDNLTIGWGGYNVGKNATNIYGYNMSLITKNDMALTAEGNGNMWLTSSKWKINENGDLFGKHSNGSYIELIGLSSDGNTAIGNGGYSNSLGKTNIYGNKINHIVNTTGGSVTYKPYYEAGDSVEIEWYGAGFVSTSGTVVFFSIPLSKPIIGSPSVAAANASSTGGLRVRQAGNYVYGATSSTHAKPSSYKAAVSGEGNYVRIEATMANSTNAVNNDACGVHALIKITFS